VDDKWVNTSHNSSKAFPPSPKISPNQKWGEHRHVGKDRGWGRSEAEVWSYPSFPKKKENKPPPVNKKKRWDNDGWVGPSEPISNQKRRAKSKKSRSSDQSIRRSHSRKEVVQQQKTGIIGRTNQRNPGHSSSQHRNRDLQKSSSEGRPVSNRSNAKLTAANRKNVKLQKERSVRAQSHSFFTPPPPTPIRKKPTKEPISNAEEASPSSSGSSTRVVVAPNPNPGRGKRFGETGAPSEEPEDGIRLDSLKVESEPLPPIRKCKSSDKSKYESLMKFDWNGLSGKPYSDKYNQKLTQSKGHGIACKCQCCTNLLNKERKVKGEANEKQPISILHEIANQEQAKIVLMVNCGKCDGRFSESEIPGKKEGLPVCRHCGESVHPRTCTYGYTWNEVYLEGVKGAANTKEAKRLAAEKALATLGKDWNYNEQIIRCWGGKRALPKKAGQYYMVSKNGDFHEYVGKGNTSLREDIFKDHTKFLQVSHDIAPNFDWHQFDLNRMKSAKDGESVDNQVWKSDAPNNSEESKTSLPSLPIHRRREMYWDEDWNPRNSADVVNISIRTYYNGEVEETEEEVTLSYTLKDLGVLFASQHLDDLYPEQQKFYDIIFRRRGSKRFCFMYDRRFVAICHCRGEVIRLPNESIKSKFNCNHCGTAWQYCTGCDQIKWPLQPMEIVCGKKCEPKVDTSNNTWYCRNCWKAFILEKESKPSPSSHDESSNQTIEEHKTAPLPPNPSTSNSAAEALKVAGHKSEHHPTKPRKEQLCSAGSDDENVECPASSQQATLPSDSYGKPTTINLTFDNAKEVKNKGVNFERPFKVTPRIFTRVITKGLVVIVETEDEDSFVVKAHLEKDYGPGNYAFEYIIIAPKRGPA